MNLRYDIQGLRALAVILVIIFHFSEQFLPGGFIGVDIFFVLSGYLISKSIINQIDEKRFNLLRFFEGRAKRIIPAYYFMLIVVLVIAAVLLPGGYFTKFITQFKYTALFISNKVFSLSLDYFGPSNLELPLLHTWSLALEMQFYFLMPFLFIFTPKKWRLPLLSILFALLLVYVQYNLWELNEKSKMYFSLPARSLEFIIGILINFMPKASKYKKITLNILGVIAFVIIILSSFMLSGDTIFPGLWSLPACISTALIVWSGSTIINEALGWKPFVYIGNWSYSLYLWHWPILAFYRFQYDTINIPLRHFVFLILMILAASLFSFYVIEEPARKLKRKPVYYLIPSMFLVAGILFLSSFKINKNLIYLPDQYVKPIENINHNKFDGYILIGDTLKNDDKILVVGDSHALSLKPFFDTVGKEYNLNFSFLSMDSYPPLKGYSDEIKKHPLFKEEVYNKLMPIANDLITESNIIIIAKQFHRYYDFTPTIKELIDELKDNQSLILLSDYPILSFNPIKYYESLTRSLSIRKSGEG